MFKTASPRVKDALKEIEIMKKTGEVVRNIPWHREGKGEGPLFVSSDIHMLIAFDVVEVDGVMYFIGFSKEAWPT